MTMQRKKLVIVGAGSAMFTQGLVADMILSNRPWRLGLVDIDPDALAVAQGLTCKMIAARQADITVEASLDRADVLPGSDVVVTTIGVGGRRAWEDDVFIPRRHGVYQPVGDTIMAGGISRALRLVPAMVDISRDVLRLCPAARFINYANPMSVICRAVRKATGAGVIGLCIGVHHVSQELARFIGAPYSEVTYRAAGVNHFTWVYDLRWNGEDAWPLVRARLAEDPSARAENPFSWSLFDAYGAYPAVNDRHVTEFFPERFPGGAYYGRRLGVDAYSFENTIAWGDKIYAEMREQALGNAPLDARVFDRDAGEHSQLLEIIASIEQDRRGFFTANLPNRGAVPNLPDDAILELTSAATARGIHALHANDFPAALAAPLIRKIAGQEVTVEAALTGNRKLVVEALLLDGCVSDAAAATRLADDLLAAHRAYLPQFE
jgi:alpha-galactosidase